MLESAIDSEDDLTKLDKKTSSVKGASAAQAGLVCPKCDALKIVKSRSKGFDGLFMRFIPRRPYRCLRCYYRFWAAEDFMSDRRRLWSWTIVVIAGALLISI